MTPALTPGDAVHGEIDWPRRFDHMQQHTGQHTLSAAFDRLLGVRTVSFHLGAAVSTIDNAIKNVSTARANFGAVQNRLEHRLTNLAPYQENLTASESRIRDVDMASEMTNFSKLQILQQAGTSMLAQANQAPQNVLTLLR